MDLGWIPYLAGVLVSALHHTTVQAVWHGFEAPPSQHAMNRWLATYRLFFPGARLAYFVVRAMMW